MMCFLSIGLMRVVRAEVYNVPPPMRLLYVSLLLDPTAAACSSLIIAIAATAAC